MRIKPAYLIDYPYRFFTCALICWIVACSSNQPVKTEREGHPDAYTTYDDAEMDEARKQANETFHQFETALNNPQPGYSDFSIKMRLATPTNYEHIWITNIVKKNEDYFGTVGNLPLNIPELQVGDTVKIDEEEISDWHYLDNWKLRGGFTIKVLRNRMTEEERKQFDVKTGIIIEE